MSKIYYDKTDKGREEISSRKYQLSPKLRPLLVMIDGKHSSEELLQRLSAIGLGLTQLDELLSAGFIEQVNRTPEPIPATSTPIHEKTEFTKVETTPTTSAIETDKNAKLTRAEAITALRQFFTETIKAHLGLRGFGLQLKVERADTVEDFAALGDDFVEALHKSKGQQIARTIEARMMQLLTQAQQAG